MNKKIKFLFPFFILSLFLLPSVSSASKINSKDSSFSQKNNRTYKSKKLEKKNNRIVYRKFLDKSVPYIGADKAHSLSVTGQGSYVVVIDSGIYSSHPMFSEKVALEACFTVANSCPNKTNKQIGKNAALPVDWHGSHVSGIAAGKASDIVGVAPDAKIIAVNVFDKDDSSSETSIINALKWVKSISSTYKIAAVNMSLGTSRIYRSTCDNVSPSLTKIIHELYSLNVAVVVAAGNSYSLGMSNPACISKVVSVAAISGSGNITSFSNISKDTTFAAPGLQIKSAGSSDSYRLASGTSMAAPHVAGVFALYRQLYPDHSIDLAVANLKSISTLAFDPYSKISVSSINVSSINNLNSTYPSTTTTIPLSTSTTISLPVEVPSIPTLPPLPSFKPFLNKIYSPTSLSDFFYIRYQDSFAPKNLVSHYVLDCGTSTYQVPLNLYSSNNIYKISQTPNFVSCFMYALMKDGTHSAYSTPIFLSRG